MDKTELLALIQSERARLESTLSQLNEAQMTQPDVEGEWSVKDLQAHFAAWTQHLARLLDAASRGETPERWDDIDRMNAHIFAENRDRPLRDVLSDFHESYRRVLRAGNTHGR